LPITSPVSLLQRIAYCPLSEYSFILQTKSSSKAPLILSSIPSTGYWLCAQRLADSHGVSSFTCNMHDAVPRRSYGPKRPASSQVEDTQEASDEAGSARDSLICLPFPSRRVDGRLSFDYNYVQLLPFGFSHYSSYLVVVKYVVVAFCSCRLISLLLVTAVILT
jgi:hypothetical protein